MKKFLAYFELRINMFIKDGTSVFFAYIFPLIFILGMGFFTSQGVNSKIIINYNSDIYDEDMKQLIVKLEENPLFILKKTDVPEQEARQKIEEGRMELFLVFNPGNTQPITILYNNSNSAGNVNSALVKAALNILIHPVEDEVTTTTVTGKKDSYIYTIFPGVVGMVLWIIAMMGSGNIIINERHLKITKKLKTIDIRPISYLAGLVLTRLLIGISLIVILIPFVYLVFGLAVKGSVLLLLLLAALAILCFLGIALIIANLTRTPDAYNGISQIIQLPLYLLGGAFFSIEFFPDWLQLIAGFSPFTAFIQCFKRVIYNDITFNQIFYILKDLTVLTAWSVFSFLTGLFTFKWK